MARKPSPYATIRRNRIRRERARWWRQNGEQVALGAVMMTGSVAGLAAMLGYAFVSYYL
jgi:hypothetical protein